MRVAVDPAVRFWRKVDRAGGPDACWPWTGARGADGYGRVSLNGTTRNASRVALTLAVGDLAPHEYACHRCDNPPCCNPAHLFAGTAHENILDMLAKGRGRARTDRMPDISRGAVRGVHLLRALATDLGCGPHGLCVRLGLDQSSWQAVAKWLAGISTPTVTGMARIERLSGGAITLTDWLRDDDRAGVNEISPVARIRAA